MKNISNNNSNEINNKLNPYNIYFEGGENSLYNSRFGKRKITYNEEYVIKKSFKKVLKTFYKNSELTNKVFKVLDYGCGDGRMFEIIERIANKFPKLSIELFAYDTCEVGLNICSNKLLNTKFDKVDDKLNKYQKNNLSIQLIKADQNNNLLEFFNNSINLLICMFAVLCHIPGRDNRQNLIKDFKNLLNINGEILINVSTLKSISKEALAYEVLRKHEKVFSKYFDSNAKKDFLKLAIEPGDLYYCVDNNKNCTEIYGHVYNAKELENDLKATGLSFSKVKILSYRQPYDLSKSKFWDRIDQFISLFSSNMLLPISITERLSKNIYIIANKKNN